MLVLKILEGQKIYIDDGAIEVCLISVGGNYGRIGITAPLAVKVLRQGACREGPARCCRCGGLLPPPGSDGVRVKASTGCQGEQDTDSGRCQAFAASTLWPDGTIVPASKGGGA
jgi:hypothetical protein